MEKKEFQESIYPFLIKKGYRAITSANGKPYDGKDIYICPQSPENFGLMITPGLTRICKYGKGGFEAKCKTQVKSFLDIDQLHEEVNHIIMNGDESGIEKYKGCFGVVLLIIFMASFLSLFISLSFNL